MMLTPVAEAKSASDQSRDSRSSRIAAPADSRLTAALRAYSDTTQPYALFWVYTFLSPFRLHPRAYCVYASAYVSARRRRTDGASMLGQPGIVVRLRR